MHCLRIQPAGLSLRHRSETSNDSAATGLHVFRFLHQVRSPDSLTFLMKAVISPVIAGDSARRPGARR